MVTSTVKPTRNKETRLGIKVYYGKIKDDFLKKNYTEYHIQRHTT